MKNVANSKFNWFLLIVWIICMTVIAIYGYGTKTSASPPTCTNTTIDAYYKCQPTAPIMLRR